MVQFHPEQLCYPVGGVKLFMTHGHNQKVKATLALLKKEAKEMGAQAALFGHTHSAYCCQEDGLWLLNPGSCGSYGGSVGLIETENGQITACKILTHADLMTDL
jgi:putative phosphoesterase